MEKIILVDEKDNEIGSGEKVKVHQEGKLHRAFSIFVFNSKGELLLQKRSKSKYHSGGLWSNTCCSHPRPDQNLKEEAERRLMEEMGIDCKLKEVFSFLYKANLGNLTEYEFDHLFVGNFDGNPRLNKEEAEDWKWIKINELRKEIDKNPEEFTAWLKICLKKYLSYWNGL
jgi:isopentenyl-diphosphate delta-isomerase